MGTHQHRNRRSRSREHGNHEHGNHEHRQRRSRPGPAGRLGDLSHRLTGAVGRCRPGDPAACRREAVALAEHAGGADLGRALAATAEQLLAHCAHSGWLPADLAQIVRRRVNADAAGLVVDLLAGWCAGKPAASTHELWHDQLHDLAAQVWWNPQRTYLEQRAERDRCEVPGVLAVALAGLACLSQLPPLAMIVPPPGQAVRTARPARQADDAVLARVRALLAKAESSDYPAEAEALSAKAQQMMSRHGLSRLVLDQPTVDLDVTTARVWLDNPYVTAKATLVHRVAEANRCRVVYHSRLGLVSVVGTASDLEATTLLVTSLLVQANRAMLAEGSRVGYRGESRTKSFRHAFLLSYAARIGERLAEADEAGIAELADELGAGPGGPARAASLLPALARRSEAVDAAVARAYPRLTGQRTTARSVDGWQAGRRAADRADLGRGRAAVDVA